MRILFVCKPASSTPPPQWLQGVYAGQIFKPYTCEIAAWTWRCKTASTQFNAELKLVEGRGPSNPKGGMLCKIDFLTVLCTNNFLPEIKQLSLLSHHFMKMGVRFINFMTMLVMQNTYISNHLSTLKCMNVRNPTPASPTKINTVNK